MMGRMEQFGIISASILHINTTHRLHSSSFLGFIKRTAMEPMGKPPKRFSNLKAPYYNASDEDVQSEGIDASSGAQRWQPPCNKAR